MKKPMTDEDRIRDIISLAGYTAEMVDAKVAEAMNERQALMKEAGLL